MPASLRELRQRRTSVSTIKKVTRAMELIAASRIIKAQQRAQVGCSLCTRADQGRVGGCDVLQRRPSTDH